MPTQQHQHHLSGDGVLEQKWSKPVVDAGWVGIPSLLLEFARELELDATDLAIIINIADHWWGPESKAFPSKETIGRRTGVQPRTVQRRIQAMEARGLIRREQRRRASKESDTNIYHLDGLREALQDLAPKGRRSRQKAARVASRDLPIAEQPKVFDAPAGTGRWGLQRERAVDGDDDHDEAEERGSGYYDEYEETEDYSPRDDDDAA